jgi:hypothetical protein
MMTMLNNMHIESIIGDGGIEYDYYERDVIPKFNLFKQVLSELTLQL